MPRYERRDHHDIELLQWRTMHPRDASDNRPCGILQVKVLERTHFMQGDQNPRETRSMKILIDIQTDLLPSVIQLESPGGHTHQHTHTH